MCVYLYKKLPGSAVEFANVSLLLAILRKAGVNLATGLFWSSEPTKAGKPRTQRAKTLKTCCFGQLDRQYLRSLASQLSHKVKNLAHGPKP